MEIAADQETTAIRKKITSKSSQISSKVIASEQLKNNLNSNTINWSQYNRHIKKDSSQDQAWKKFYSLNQISK